MHYWNAFELVDYESFVRKAKIFLSDTKSAILLLLYTGYFVCFARFYNAAATAFSPYTTPYTHFGEDERREKNRQQQQHEKCWAFLLTQKKTFFWYFLHHPSRSLFKCLVLTIHDVKLMTWLWKLLSTTDTSMMEKLKNHRKFGKGKKPMYIWIM